VRGGERVQPEKELLHHFKNGPDGWPEWLAEEARLHDPAAATPSAVPAPAADRAGDPIVRRERYATVISKWHRDPEQELYTQGADAVIAIADAEQAGIRAAALADAVTAMEALMADGEQEPGALVERVREMADESAPAVLPASVDRATVLNEGARHLYTVLFPAVYADMGQKAAEGVNRAVSELRRLAVEAPGPDRCSGCRYVPCGDCHPNAVEARDGQTTQDEATCFDPIECSHEAALGQAQQEIRRLREKHKASLRRADEINNELMEEVQRYAIGTERPVLWSVYNQMHLRALKNETTLERVQRTARRLAAHAVGFKDVLDDSDHGPWGRTVGADIAELIEALSDQPATEPAGGVQQPKEA